MSDNVHIELAVKDYPYTDDSGAAFVVWGSIYIYFSDGETRITLLDWQWDLSLLAEWFIDNHTALLEETLLHTEQVPSYTASKNLAQALKDMHSREFDDEEKMDQWYDYLYEYSSRHVLKFALPGAAIPRIVIGIREGRGNISLYNESENWAYEFDMPDFVSELSAELRRSLAQWLERSEHPKAKERVALLLQRLQEESQPSH